LKFSEAGGMAERLKAAVLKTAEGSRLPWVQILLPPPFFIIPYSSNISRILYDNPLGKSGFERKLINES
jgi:hypothetical protein